MEKATNNLGLVDLSKQNFRQTLNSLQDDAHSLIRLSIQWKEIEGVFDSTKIGLEEKAKELEALEESLRKKALEQEAKEKEKEKEFDESLKSKLSDLENKEKEKVEQLMSLTKRIELMEKFADEKLKELGERAKILELKVKEESEFEPLVSFLAQKARREKIKADAVKALEYFKEKKLESEFPLKAIRKLIVVLERTESTVRRTNEKAKSKTNNIAVKSEASSLILFEQDKAKRQRVTEAITPIQNSTVNQLGSLASPSEVNHQPEAKDTKPSISSVSINAEMLSELLKKPTLQETDLSNALKCSQDSAKLVLDTSMALCPTDTEGSYEFKLLISSVNCFLLFDQMKKLPPQNEDSTVREEAKKLATHWKDKVSKRRTSKLEVVCFLKFLGIFKVVSEFKANDLLALLDNSYWRTASPDLCKFLELENAIPDFIQSLIKTGHLFQAISYIYSFDMVQRFQPVSAIINEALRITKESSEKSFRDAINIPALQVAALDRQIKSLKTAIRCISCHKLQSEFQLRDLEEQIESLFKVRSKLQTEKPPNVAETGSVTSNNTALESSKTITGSSSVIKPLPESQTRRGQKRSVSGNIQSPSVQVSSVPSNHFAVYGYPLNQRHTWPVNHFAGGFAGAPNSNYNAYQRTQPGQPQLHYLPRHLNPFYRNHL